MTPTAGRGVSERSSAFTFPYFTRNTISRPRRSVIPVSMSIYSKLPIYNSVFFLLKDLYERVPKFSKQYKYLLGEKMLECLSESVVLLGRISGIKSNEKRIDCVMEINDNMGKLLMYTRVANELHQLGGENAYFFLSEKILDILNQTENWKKFLQKKEHSRNSPSADGEAGKKECHLPLLVHP